MSDKIHKTCLNNVYGCLLHRSRASRVHVEHRDHVIATFHKMVTMTLGYIIMLAVMTFNYWILISAVLGAGIGHLLVRPAVHAMCLSKMLTQTDVNGTLTQRPGQNEILIQPPAEVELGEMWETPPDKRTHYNGTLCENKAANGHLLQEKCRVTDSLL